jgi:hypothetical protein
MQKGLVSRDTSPVRFCREETVRIPCPKIPVAQTQLAEGFEPPTL